MIRLIKEKLLNKKFLTFGIIGGINTVLAQLIYLVAVKMSIEPSLSSLLGDTLTMILSYFLNMKFTYHEKPSLKSALTFPISYVPGLLINMATVFIVVNWLSLPKEWAKAVSLPITIPLNFVCMSFIVKMSSKKQVD